MSAERRKKRGWRPFKGRGQPAAVAQPEPAAESDAAADIGPVSDSAKAAPLGEGFDQAASGLFAQPEGHAPANEWFSGVDLSAPPPDATQPLPVVEAGEAPGETLGDLLAPKPGALPPGAAEPLLEPLEGEAGAATAILRTVSLADLARAHERASVEQTIAEEVARRSERRKKILLTVVLALVGVLIGSGAALLAVARERRTGGAQPKVGLSAGVLPSATPTAPPSTEPTGPQPAQIVLVILGAGEGSNETSANLARFTQQRLALTFGVFPQRAGTAGDAAAIQASGGQSIVYQPVGGTKSSAKAQRGGVEGGQSNRQFANMLVRNLSGVSGGVGLSPYGFAAPDYPAKAVRLIPAIAFRQNAFIFQSQPGTRTALASSAATLGARYMAADIRLDDKPGEKYLRQRWEAGLARAESARRAVIVCRLTGLTARVLPSLLAALDTNKFQLTLASAAAGTDPPPATATPTATPSGAATGTGG